MKRYLLFAGEGYYPIGGWNDYVTDDDDDQKLMQLGVRMEQEQTNWIDWWHIVDTQTGRFIHSSDPNANVGDIGIKREWARDHGYLKPVVRIPPSGGRT